VNQQVYVQVLTKVKEKLKKKKKILVEWQLLFQQENTPLHQAIKVWHV
jgi:hypothetical protein